MRIVSARHGNRAARIFQPIGRFVLDRCTIGFTDLRPKGEATRARILEAALALFRERGYQETTMRARVLPHVLAGLLLLISSGALAIPVELTFWGSLTSAPEAYARLDIFEGSPIKGRLVYESDTPSRGTDPGGFTHYDDPFLDGSIRIGDDDTYSLRFRPSCCDVITLAPDLLFIGLGLEDTPNWMRFGSLNLRIIPADADAPIFDGSLPTTLDLREFAPISSLNRVLGAANRDLDLGTSRLRLTLALEGVHIRPLEAEIDKMNGGKPTTHPKKPVVPEPSTALLLGIGLVGLAARTRERA